MKRSTMLNTAGLLWLAIALIGSTSGNAASDGGIKLGILEDVPGSYAGQAHFRAVRILFQQEGREWRPYPSDCSDQQCLKAISADYPESVTWTVGLAGRKLGQVTGHTPGDFEWYSGVGLQRLASRGSIPTVGKRSMAYAGYADEPVFRPLIASSGSYLADPESWRPLALPRTAIRALRQQFRHKFPKALNCKGPETDPIQWSYTDADIGVAQSFVAKTGWALAELKLMGDKCEGPPDDLFGSQWFLISPGGQVRFLDSGLNFLDAGDYDHSGRSAVIFSIDRDNRGGYEMFYDHFRRRALFEFSYH